MFTRSCAAFMVAAAVLASPGVAHAHVTVNPREADAGGFAKLTFRVPNERPETGTTSVEVNFPEDAPVANVSVKPTPGWEYAVERRTLDEPLEVHGNEVAEVVSKVTWTGGPIAPGEFQEFDVSVGPLPDDTDTMLFPSIQTYEGGEVVRWIEEPLDDGEEPEHPAPVLTLTAASDDETGGDAAGSGGDVAAEPVAATSDDDGTDALAVVALVVGVLGVILGALALARRRSS